MWGASAMTVNPVPIRTEEAQVSRRGAASTGNIMASDVQSAEGPPSCSRVPSMCRHTATPGASGASRVCTGVHGWAGHLLALHALALLLDELRVVGPVGVARNAVLLEHPVQHQELRGNMERVIKNMQSSTRNCAGIWKGYL